MTGDPATQPSVNGESAILRLAGLPIRLWLAAAAPDLFDLVRALERSEGDYLRAASALAERLGNEVVPRPDLPTTERHAVLSLRRRLHRGQHLSPGQAGRLREIAAPLPDLDRVTRLSAEVLLLGERAAARIAQEHDRLLAAPWHLLHSVRGGRAGAAPGVLADIERRLADGEPWTSKKMRRRSDYLWRMIARGAAKTTPRAWLGQVALVPISGPASGEAASLSVNGQTAVEWTENVHASRLEVALAGGDLLDPDVPLSLTPLHRVEGDRLAVWTLDGTRRMVTYRLRRTPAIENIVTALGPGAGPVTGSPPGLVGKLVELGVLEVSQPLRQRHGRWSTPSPRATTPATGFVDVYRRAEGALDADLAAIERAFVQYRRISLLIGLDATDRHSDLRERIGQRPRPIMDVYAEDMAAQIARGELSKPTPMRGAWPLPHRADSGYARLLAELDTSSRFDITPELLDAVGAPDAPITWPVDCAVRPLPRGGWVLDNTQPAAMLDARFIDTLRRLHGAVPAADAYRAFLAELDRLTGVPSVELLVPPLTERAANAVRRPRYTRAWTGDPNPRHYGRAWQSGEGHYLPLGELTIHSEAGRVIVSHAGRRVRICLHATRNALPPWATLVALLRADSQQQAAQCRKLRCSLTAFPERAFVPRITVAGSLVVSAAQWRVPADRLDQVRVGDLAGLRALVRLRDRLGLPRWVFVGGPYGNRSLACDLESLRAPRVFDQVCQALTGGEPYEVTIAEMLPGPGELSVTDHAAEFLIRLPHAMPPHELAAAAAQASAGST